MDVMNKIFWYVFIFAAIATYFYVGYSVSSHWEAAVKYGNKVTHDTLGKEIPLFNLKESRQGDFYVIIDSLKNRKYFRVVGLTSDSLLCVNYGKDASVLPQILDYSSYLTSPGFFIDKRVSWVDEVMKNEENFDDKLEFIDKVKIDSFLSNNIVIGFELNKLQTLTWFEIITDFNIGNPFLLGILILGLMFLIFIFENLLNVFIQKNKPKYRFIIVITSISLYSILHRYIFLLSPRHEDQWYGALFIFISYSLLFIIFQYVKQKLSIQEFEKREFIKFSLIIFMGVLLEVFSTLVLFTILEDTDLQEGTWKQIFFITLQDAFKFWIAFATANFLNNLIGYISSLRRKSKQLQTVTSDAQVSAEALLQSEAHVNTHFLYNSLHAIAALAPVAPEKTETLALSLAKYYRYTTNRNDETWITIKEDAEALTSYLEVEKIRLGEKLTYAFDVSDDVSGVKIPKFLLQPLVENAIKYGYDVDKDTTNVKISFHKLDHTILKISVCDSGKSFGDQMEIGTGIRQVKDLLKRFYPEGHTISFVNEPVKCVEILLKVKN